MPGTSIEKIVPFFLNQGIHKIVDFGAGTFHNTKYLQKKGFIVVAVDKTSMINKFAIINEKNKEPLIISAVSSDTFKILSINVDAIVCNFVMNLLDDITNFKLAKVFYSKLKPGGVILVEVKERKKPKINRAMNTEQLDRLFLLNGFYRITKFRGRHSLSVLYEKYQ